MDSTILALIQGDLGLIWKLRSFVEEELGAARMHLVRNSGEAILYLRGVGIYGDRQTYPLPSYVLLEAGDSEPSDLELLAWLRETEAFSTIPIVFLTSESHKRDFSGLCVLDPTFYIIDRDNLKDELRLLFLGSRKDSACEHAVL